MCYFIVTCGNLEWTFFVNSSNLQDFKFKVHKINNIKFWQNKWMLKWPKFNYKCLMMEKLNYF